VKNELNTVTKQNTNYYGWTFKNYLTFNTSLNNLHNIIAMIGQEANEWGNQSLSGGSSSLPTNTIHQISLGDPAFYQSGSGQGDGALNSYYGRLNYNFSEKYYATFTFRADGSSNFAQGHKWGYFPSAAVSYRISSEPFMQGISSVLNDLKIRAGWGQTGNSGRSGYLYGAPLAFLPTNLGQGFRQAKHGNTLVTWETAEQIDFGIDAGFLQNRVTLTLDYYRKMINDLLMENPMPAYMGSLGNPSISLKAPTGNFGSIENKGFEIQLKTQNLVGKFQWETDLNFTRNRNTLVDLGIKDAALDGMAQWFTLVSRSTNGMPLGEFYGYKVAGVFQDKEDILNSPVQYAGVGTNANGEPNLQRTSTVWPGDLKFADLDRNDTIDVRDRTYLGSPQPKFTFGFNNTFRYAGFDLGIFMTGSYGNKVYNFVKQGFGSGLADMRSAWNNQLEEVTNRAKLQPIGEATAEWYNDINNVQVSNPGTTIPRAVYSDPNQNTRTSDRYIEDGSYIRIRNISLGYNFPASLTQKLHLSGLRVYTNIQNAYTFTKYSGYDPEVGQDTLGSYVYGVDNGRYPSPRIYTLGLNIGL
jgi:TonB-linked SusC/RagA family outer membrane protein